LSRAINMVCTDEGYEGLDGFAGLSYSESSIEGFGQSKGNWERAMQSFYYGLGYAYRFYFTERTGETRADELRR
jgi:hypothetical protein